MAELDDFLSEVLPLLNAAEVALHEGEPGPRSELWSHRDPVTLFGAEVNRTGWAELAPTFDWLADRFTACQSFDHEVVAAGVSGDLGYLACIERIVATVNGESHRYALRSTTVLRREEGAWRVVHRHGDPYREPEPAEGPPASP